LTSCMEWISGVYKVKIISRDGVAMFQVTSHGIFLAEVRGVPALEKVLGREIFDGLEEV
jgi:hypothetical protein